VLKKYKCQQVGQQLRAALVEAMRVAHGPQRRLILLSAAVLFLTFFVLRGGLTPSGPTRAWPWPVGTILTGETTEPYLFIVITPYYLLTFQPYTMLRWAIMALLFGWAMGMLREASAKQACKTRGGRAGVGLLGGILSLAGAGACCGSILPAVLALGGLGAYSEALDGISVAVWAGIILSQGHRLAGCEDQGKC
jgi:hypothetical protein